MVGTLHLIFLRYCVHPRMGSLVRSVDPGIAKKAMDQFGALILRSFASIIYHLDLPPAAALRTSLPLRHTGAGLSSWNKLSDVGCVASWIMHCPRIYAPFAEVLGQGEKAVGCLSKLPSVGGAMAAYLRLQCLGINFGAVEGVPFPWGLCLSVAIPSAQKTLTLQLNVLEALDLFVMPRGSVADLLRLKHSGGFLDMGWLCVTPGTPSSLVDVAFSLMWAWGLGLGV